MSIAEKLTAIAENEQKVYDAGYSLGYDDGEKEGYADGTDIGKLVQEKAFWNLYVPKVTDNFTNRFSGLGWTNDTFKPNKNMKPTNAYMMFYYSNINGSLPDILESQGVSIDWTSCPTAGHCFQYSAFTEIEFSCSTTLSATFNQCQQLVELSLDIADTCQFTGRPFYNCVNLERLHLAGTIGQNGFDVHWSQKLHRASITSIIGALSGTTNNLKIVLPLAAVNTAFETKTGAADGSHSNQWYTLLGNHQNWTISLL